MYLALHRGGNRLTRWWACSPYSHCEIVIDEVCYSASMQDGGVRGKRIALDPDRWELIPIDSTHAPNVLTFYEQTRGQGYDWLGLFGSQILNRRIQNPGKFFCSEWCAAALNIPHPESYTPHTLAALINFLNKGGLHGST